MEINCEHASSECNEWHNVSTVKCHFPAFYGHIHAFVDVYVRKYPVDKCTYEISELSDYAPALYELNTMRTNLFVPFSKDGSAC